MPRPSLPRPSLSSEVVQALEGDEASIEALIHRLTPVIQARVTRSLLRDGRAHSSGTFRQVVKDLVQQVFVDLFDQDAKVLRDWNPDRGLSLENFVGLIAERRVCSTLRRLRRNPWTEEPAEDGALDGPMQAADPERQARSRQRLALALDGFRAKLSPLGWQVFELLFLFERTVEEVGEITGLSRDAVYAWRSRLRKLAATVAADLDRGHHLGT